MIKTNIKYELGFNYPLLLAFVGYTQDLSKAPIWYATARNSGVLIRGPDADTTDDNEWLEEDDIVDSMIDFEVNPGSFIPFDGTVTLQNG